MKPRILVSALFCAILALCFSGCAVVGARYKDDIGTYPGGAYVFERSGASWTQVAKLTASDEAGGDYFGWSVAIFGDYVLVAALGDDVNSSFSGSAYVFQKPSGGWGNREETAKRSASDGAEYDFFGESVAISDDYVVVGAWMDDDKGSSSGSAYAWRLY